MNRIARMLTIAGFGLVAGATIGAGPALAATAGGQSASTSQTTVKQADRDRVVGYYRNRTSCEIAGRIGERLNRWDDYRCRPGFAGGHHGSWILIAEYDSWGGGHDGDHHGPWHGGHDWDHNGHGDGDHGNGGGDHGNGGGDHGNGGGDHGNGGGDHGNGGGDHGNGGGDHGHGGHDS